MTKKSKNYRAAAEKIAETPYAPIKAFELLWRSPSSTRR